MLILGDDRGAGDRKAWPPTLPPVFAADASSTDPNVKAPAANAIIANLANLLSFFLKKEEEEAILYYTIHDKKTVKVK